MPMKGKVKKWGGGLASGGCLIAQVRHSAHAQGHSCFSGRCFPGLFQSGTHFFVRDNYCDPLQEREGSFLLIFIIIKNNNN